MRAAVRWVYDSGLASPDLTIVWHAGEPLVLPQGWYRDAFAACTSLIGVILGITAFMKISLHSDFVSKILG